MRSPTPGPPGNPVTPDPSGIRVDALLRESSARIGREDAEPLLIHALGVDWARLFAHATDPVAAAAAARDPRPGRAPCRG